jgi:hypothetical protein
LSAYFTRYSIFQPGVASPAIPSIPGCRAFMRRQRITPCPRRGCSAGVWWIVATGTPPSLRLGYAWQNGAFDENCAGLPVAQPPQEKNRIAGRRRYYIRERPA